LYRLAEAFVWFLPVGFVLFWVLFPGRELIFPWIDAPLPEKTAWLNVPFLFARDGVGLLVMALLSLWFVRASRRADVVQWAETYSTIGPAPAIIRRLAAVLGLVYAVVYTMLAFDLIMSLAPHWHSTLFGAYFFAGAYWSALTAIGVLATLGWRPRRHDTAGERGGVLHDLGKLVFAFSIFWGYLLWSQYLPIWYAGIPEETFFVVPRVHRLPWGILGWTTLILVWLIPFTTLLGRRPKRTPLIFGSVCALGLIGMWLERYVLVTPSLSPRVIPYGWVEPVVTAGFAGLFGLCTLPGLALVPAHSGERS
jgi:hypothetical protein